MMRRLLARALALGVALGAVATTPSMTVAQGTLSTQGFGYPLGGLSTRAAATGGSMAEFDHLSSRNPAALGGWLRSGLYIQYDPELRTVSTADATDRMVAPRFGAVAAGFEIGQWTVGLSSNSFLDRSFETEIRSGVRLGGDSVLFTENFRSRGAVGDTRLAVSYALNRAISIGAGLHLFTGENRLSLRRLFDDSTAFGTFDRTLSLSYSGTGASAGVIVTPVRGLSIAGSYRVGGSMKLRVSDTVRTEANVPNRFGLGARLDFIPGLTVYGSADREEWSRMSTLGSTAAAGVDAWEYAGGVEFGSTQRQRFTSWTYALGYRQRDLPFRAAGATVSEKSFSGGASAPLAGGRATLDVAVQRANREAAGNVKERAWLLSVGVSIRP